MSERIADILRTAPELGTGSPTLGWVHAAARSIMTLNGFDFAASVRIPLLIVAGGNETVVSVRALDDGPSLGVVTQRGVIAALARGAQAQHPDSAAGAA